MTISMADYFQTRKSDRKKEPRYLNVINSESCTSCNSCATVCPVDCIFEVIGDVPSNNYHQIDTSRCIGCQLCYRVPQESTDFYTMEVCPWNAIDIIVNPNVKPDEFSVLEPYYLGDRDDMPWPKLEEYGYQFFLDGVVYLTNADEELHQIVKHFQDELWYYGDDEKCRIVGDVEKHENFTAYYATPQGRAVLDVIYPEYEKIFQD